MRWLFLLLAAVVGMGLPAGATIFAESTDLVEIASITHTVEAETKESITFQLLGKAVPRMFSMKGEKPRLVIDLPGCIYKGKNVISLADGKLATAIRIGLHQTPEQKTRVVIDLAKDRAVHYTHQYSEGDNRLQVELASDSIIRPSNDILPAGQPQVPKVQENTEAVTAEPPPVQPVPPFVSEKAIKTEPAPEAAPAGAATAQLLDISFDDSSDKGEMVLFHLNDFHPPSVSAVEKDTPRVLCDFMAMGLGKGIQETILANGKYVESIHTKKLKNPDKVQVILELTPDRDYDLQQVFFKNDNLFVLIINELQPESAGK